MDWITSTRSRFFGGPFYAKLWPTHRQTDRQSHSHTDTETDRNTGKQHTDTQTHTDKYTDRQTTLSHRQNGYKHQNQKCPKRPKIL